jgi:hypothetical protein
MAKQQKLANGRWLLLLVLAMASIVFTGCEKGSLGLKGGTAIGSIINTVNDKPLSEVLVRATGPHQSMSTYTDGDGSFSFHDMSEGTWEFSVEKLGYILINETSTDTMSIVAAEVDVHNGQTVTVPTIKMDMYIDKIQGSLKGYPIDRITGRPLRNFTVSQTDPFISRKSKTFELADDFKTTGFTGLPGGRQNRFTLTANNYNTKQLSLPNDNSGNIPIGITPTDLGVIKMDPLTINIAGTLRNLPGYILDIENRDILIWAETAGKVVASFTDNNVADAYKGSVNYTLSNVPVTTGSVAVKCKVRGYDVITINPAVSIPSTMPEGVIGGIDADFGSYEPIKRDLRVVITGTAPSDDEPSSFNPGNVCRVYIKQGGRDIVPYVDVVSQNYRAEAYISNVITGYPINIIAVNQSYGYYRATSEDITVQEDGNSAFTYELQLQ